MLLDLSSREPGAPSVIPLSHHRVATEGSGFETPSDGFWRLAMTSLLCFLLSLVVGERISACACSLLQGTCASFSGARLSGWGAVRREEETVKATSYSDSE